MPTAVFFNCKGATQQEEYLKICALNEMWLTHDAVRIIEQGELYAKKESGYVPFRNLYFLLWINALYPDKDIIINQVLEWQTDKNKQFYREVEGLFKKLNNSNAKILTPFANYTKSALVKEYLENDGKPETLLKYTYSCLEETLIPCGRCSSCINRYIAFRNNGLSENMAYTPTFDDWKALKKKQGNYSWDIAKIALPRYLEAKKAFEK
jgi:7-cyano-7-deazaguanine synthase in queuosine biosynthesis